jgi:NTE family protein
MKLLPKILLALLLATSCLGANAQQFIETSEANVLEAQQRKPFSGGKPKLGLVLGGGGARGAAEVGVLKVLAEEGLKFDYVVGTSIGAVVGGFYCLGATPEQMATEFESGRVMRHFMTAPLPVKIAALPISAVPRILGSKAYDGLYDGKKFKKYLMGKMSAHERQIEDLKPVFAAVCLNVLNGKPYMIRQGNLAQVMQASCAVPELRKPVEIGDQLFCDGGVTCNLPVKQCRQLGADFVIAVNIDEPFTVIPSSELRKPGSMVKRMLKWELYELDLPQALLADITIHPDTSGISLITTSKKLARKGIAAGEASAREALPEIRKRLAEFGIAFKSQANQVSTGP